MQACLYCRERGQGPPTVTSPPTPSTGHTHPPTRQLNENALLSSSEDDSNDEFGENSYQLHRSQTELNLVGKDKEFSSGLDKSHSRVNRKKMGKKGEFFQAIKSLRDLAISQPTGSNIATWLKKFWKNIEKSFPTLSNADKVKIIILRLPNDISSFLTASEVKSKKELFEWTSTLYAHRALDHCNSYQRFYQACLPFYFKRYFIDWN